MKENGTGANEKQHLVDIDACGRYIAGRIGFRTAAVEDVMAYMVDFADKHTVDAVEVVRCEKCQYWNKRYETKGICLNHNSIVTFTSPNFYCACGERKHNE